MDLPEAYTGILNSNGGIDMSAFARSLIEDLNQLRSGKISIEDARARAKLARQILSAARLVVTARALLERAALPVNEKPGGRRGGKRR